MSITDFLLARIAEDEAAARAAIEPDQMHPYGDKKLPQVKVHDVPDEVRGYLGGSWGEHFARHDPARVLAECAAKRAIIKQHEDWPVLIQREPPMETLKRTGSINDLSFTMTQEIMWLTEREYVNRFGEDPPTAPMIRTLAGIYADHPDYQQEWVQ